MTIQFTIMNNSINVSEGTTINEPIFINSQKDAALISVATHRTIAHEKQIWTELTTQKLPGNTILVDNFNRIDKEAYFAIKASYFNNLKLNTNDSDIRKIREALEHGLNMSTFEREKPAEYKFCKLEYLLNRIETNINDDKPAFANLEKHINYILEEFYLPIANNISTYLEQEKAFNQTTQNENEASINQHFKSYFENNSFTQKLSLLGKAGQYLQRISKSFSSSTPVDPLNIKNSIKTKFTNVTNDKEKNLITDRVELNIREPILIPFYNVEQTAKGAALKKAFRQAELCVVQALTKNKAISKQSKQKIITMISENEPEILYSYILNFENLPDTTEEEKQFKLFLKIFYAQLIIIENKTQNHTSHANNFLATNNIINLLINVTTPIHVSLFHPNKQSLAPKPNYYQRLEYTAKKSFYNVKTSAYFIKVEDEKTTVNQSEDHSREAEQKLARSAGIDYDAFVYMSHQAFDEANTGINIDYGTVGYNQLLASSPPKEQERFTELRDKKIAEYKEGKEKLSRYVITPAITAFKAQDGPKTWGGLRLAVKNALTTQGVGNSPAEKISKNHVDSYYAIKQQNDQDTYRGTASSPAELELNSTRKQILDLHIINGNKIIQDTYKNIYDSELSDDKIAANNYSLSSAQLRLDEVRDKETSEQRKARIKRAMLQNARLLKDSMNDVAITENNTKRLKEEILRDDHKNRIVLDSIAKRRTWWGTFLGKPAARGFAAFTSLNTTIVLLGLFTPLAPAAALYLVIMITTLSFTYMLGSQGIIDFNEWIAKDTKNVVLNEWKRKYAQKVLYGIVALTLIGLSIGAGFVFFATFPVTAAALLTIGAVLSIGTIGFGAYRYFKNAKNSMAFTPTERVRHKVILFIGLSLLTCIMGMILGLTWPIWVGAIAAFATGYIINYYLQRFSISDALIKKFATQDKHGIIRLYWGFKLENKLGPNSLMFLKFSFTTNIVLALLYAAIGYRQIMKLAGDDATLPITQAPIVGPIFEASLPFIASFSFLFIFTGYLLLSTGPMAKAIQWVSTSLDFLSDKKMRSRFSLKEFITTWFWHKPGNFLKNPDLPAWKKVGLTVVNIVAFIIFPLMAIIGMAALLINNSGKTLSNIVRDLFHWEKPINDPEHPDYDPNEMESQDSQNAYIIGLAVAITGITIKTPLVASSCVNTMQRWMEEAEGGPPKLSDDMKELVKKAKEADNLMQEVNELVGVTDTISDAYIKKYLAVAKKPENADTFSKYGFLILRVCNALLNAELASDFIINATDDSSDSSLNDDEKQNQMITQLIIFSGAFSQSFVLAEIGRQGYSNETIKLMYEKINALMDKQYAKAFRAQAAKNVDDEQTSVQSNIVNNTNNTNPNTAATTRPTIPLKQAFKRTVNEYGTATYQWDKEALLPTKNQLTF